jgi:serine O-acetyltransferase
MDRDLWTKIQDEIKLRVDAEPTLGSFLYSLVLSKKDLLGAVSSILASKLHSDALSAMDIKKFIIDVYRDCKGIEEDLEADIKFFKDHDPACNYFSTTLWNNDRHTMALFFQNRASEVFGVDIHPAAKIAGGVMIDHATGVVIGETCEIGPEVSIFQGVTLGGKGFESGKRHPNIKKGASIFAASTVLGDITIGEGAIIAAGSLVLNDVAEDSTVAGVPAKVI